MLRIDLHEENRRAWNEATVAYRSHPENSPPWGYVGGVKDSKYPHRTWATPDGLPNLPLMCSLAAHKP